MEKLVDRMMHEFGLLDEFDDAEPSSPVDAGVALQLPALDRSQRGLVEVPEEVWARPWLTKLVLSRNRLATLDYEKLSHLLPALTLLDLSYNALTSLSLALTHLSELRVSGCPLVELDVSDCPHLELLYADSSRLPILPSCAGLVSLSLAGCRMSCLPEDVGWSCLTYLDVSRNNLARLPPLPPGLLQLMCSDNALLARLDGLPASLQRCEAARCGLVELDLSIAAGLQYLDVRSNALTELDARWCGELKEILLSHNERLESLFLCSSLEKIIADNCNLTCFCDLPPGLTFLSASCNWNLCSVSALPDTLQSLSLCFCPELSSLPALPSSLTSLALAHCPHLKLELPELPHLSSLFISRSPLVAPPSQLPTSLGVLRASHCSFPLDLRNLELLEILDVSGCPRGEAPLEWSALREVHCDECPWMTSTQADHHFEGPPSLGTAWSIGSRPSMEDAWGSRQLGEEEMVLVLCDGHAGDEAASFVARHLLNNVRDDDVAPRIATADEALRQHLAGAARHAGTTVLVAVVGKDDVTVTNVGDSRALRIANANKWERVSHDHKPYDEEDNVRARGGWVEKGRVNGVLGVSRALGDFHLRPAVSNVPWVGRCRHEGVLVLGCDGLFDELPDGLVARLVAGEPLECAQRLRDAALVLGSDDNISVMVYNL